MTIAEAEKGNNEDNQESDAFSMESIVDPESHLDSKIGLQPPEKLEPTPVSDIVEAEPEYMSGPKVLLTTGIVALASFIMLLDTSIIVTAIPRITSHFHSLGDVGWYGSAYLLSSASLQPLTGQFYGQFNAKFTYLTFFGIFELGSLICGVSQSSNMLIVGRAIAGMGASGLQNGGLTIVASCAPPEKRPALLGFLIGFAQIGILVGPLLGGLFTEYTTWRWCFFINLPLGALVTICLLFIKIPNQTASRVTLTKSIRSIFSVFDLVGFLLFAPTMIMFLLALEWGGASYSWNSATIIGLFCGAAGNFALFLAWEYKKGGGAMIPFGIVKKRIVWSSCLVTIFFGGALLITSYYLAIYFQAVRERSPTMSGVDVIPGIFSSLFASVTAGVLVGRLGYYLPFILVSGVLNSIAMGLISTWNPHTSAANWIGDQVLAGIGRGIGLQMTIVAVTNVLTPAEQPVGIALLIFCQQFGGSVWLAIASTTFSSSLSSAIKKYASGVDPQVILSAGVTGYRSVVSVEEVQGVVLAYSKAVNHVFYLGAGCAVASFVFAWWMGWRSVRTGKREGAV